MTLLIVAGPLKVALSGVGVCERPELPEAVEEVAADLLAEVRADRVVRPDQRLRRREAAIDRNVLGRGHLRYRSRKRASCNKGERNLGGQEPRGKVPAKRD
jgi:hypothetical protein